MKIKDEGRICSGEISAVRYAVGMFHRVYSLIHDFSKEQANDRQIIHI